MPTVANTLMERRATVMNELQSLVDRVGAENRAFSAEEEQSYQRMNAEVDTLAAKAQGQLDAEKRDAKIETEFASRQGSERPADTQDGNAEFRSFLRGEGPSTIETRDLQVGAATEGGNAVPRSFANSLYEHMVEMSAVLQAGPTVLNTAGGEPFDLPNTTDHGTAAATAEEGLVPEDDPAFGKVTLGAFKYGQLVDVSTELLQDNGVAIDGYLSRILGRNLGNIVGTKFVVGAGTTEPFGAVTQSTLGKAAPAGLVASFGDQSAADRGFDLLIDLFYSVIAPYRNSPSCHWMMSDPTAAVVRKLKDADGRYAWQPAVIAGQPDTILGKPVVVDTNMPDPAASAKAILFGDFAAFHIRYAGGLRIDRSVDAKFANDQVSFRGLIRVDSALVDTAAVKHFAFAAV